MDISRIISSLLGIAILFGGLLVYTRNSNKAINRIFFAICVSSASWAVVFRNIEFSTNINVVILLNQSSYLLALVMMFFVVLFTYYFPQPRDKKWLRSYTGLLIVTGILSFTDYIAGTVSISEDGNSYIFTYGNWTYFYSFVLLIGVVLILTNLYKGLKKSSTPVQRSQVNLMTIGFVITFLLGILLAVISPIIYPLTNIDDFAPFSLIIFIFFAGMAIVKHKLFDFKAVLVRSFAYVISTGVFVLVYATSALLIKRLLFPDQQLTTSQLVTNIVIMVLLLSFYGKLNSTFNRVTNKIFYRDAYNPQELISRLNKTLVTNVNLDELLTKSALIIQEEMKTSFCTFYIRETSYFDARVLGAHRKLPEFDGIEEIQELASKTHSKLFSSEFDTVTENDKKLSNLLKKNDVEVLARLTNTLDYHVKGIGYIFLGSKKSGSQFTTQDIKVLEIIANELVIAIENVLRFEEIEQFNVTLQKKIDDATKELKQTNEKLRALDEAKDEFVSMASHQLRTPLTSIKGYISMVLEGDAGKVNETQEKMLGQAFFSSQRMVYLISDLLNVSRLKTGKFVIESKPVYLPDVVESEINQLHEGANAKNLKLTFTKPKEFPTMNLDEMKLRQVIMNFSDNAIYYTPSGGKINIELKDTPKAVEFTVKDSGIGVPKEQQHKLFTKFYRADNARKARPDGTGLGLFMAKKVIIAQGGSMIFDSKLGQGSTFGFSFPKEKLLVQPAETKDEDKKD